MTQQTRSQRLSLVAIKAIHSLIFFGVQSAIGYLIYTGLQGRHNRKAAVAAAIVGSESLIYAGNGFRCPLTDIAEDLGAESGSVTDIFLPEWLARNVANIHVPLVVLAAFLHARNWNRNAAR